MNNNNNVNYVQIDADDMSNRISYTNMNQNNNFKEQPKEKTPKIAYVYLGVVFIGIILTLVFNLFFGFLFFIVPMIYSIYNFGKRLIIHKVIFIVSIISIVLGIIKLIILPMIDFSNKADEFTVLSKDVLSKVETVIYTGDLECSKNNKVWIDYEDTPAGDKNIYYFMINTANDGKDLLTKEVQEDTEMLLGSSYKSSFDNANLFGYVHWVKPSNAGSNKYYIRLVDANGYGHNGIVYEKNLKKNRVKKKVSIVSSPNKNQGSIYYRCRLNY